MILEFACFEENYFKTSKKIYTKLSAKLEKGDRIAELEKFKGQQLLNHRQKADRYIVSVGF
jgi:hypothetical protein